MTGRFDSFVIFAEMRTGSNFLEANLNAFASFQSYGEAFNPHFIGYPHAETILGFDLKARDKNPMALLEAIRQVPGHLGGFRFFNDHDPRVLAPILQDRRCAKIILTRNPLESYVSWKIAQETGQWKLTDVRKRKASKIVFDGREFSDFVGRIQEFQISLLNNLQKNGQTPFYIAYEDLQDLDVVNGLAQFLGSDEKLESLDGKLKPQNPAPLSEKVSNFEAVSAALAQLDRFNLARTPNFEPRRGAAVPSYIATPGLGLLFMPVPGGPTESIAQWMSTVAGVSVEGLQTGMTQRELRAWKAAQRPVRSFAVLRHPVVRLHEVFCSRILDNGPGSFRKIRRTLCNRFGLPIPEELGQGDYDLDAHRTAFLAFLDFVQANLNGQTAIRQDGHWANQAGLFSGFAQLLPPDVILREEELPTALAALASTVGAKGNATFAPEQSPAPFALSDIYDDEIETRVQAVHARDYEAFGFDRWR